MLYLKEKRKKFNRKKNFLFFKKFKLKKKFRLWRLVKSFLLYKIYARKFKHLHWIYNNNRVLRHQFYLLLGNKIKYFLPKKKQHFFNFLQQNELKLHIFLIRAKFCLKNIDSFHAIKNKQISVCRSIQLSPYFQLYVNAVIQKKRLSFINSFRYKKHKWRKYRWHKVRKYLKWRYSKFIYLRPFIYNKRSYALNYFEINFNVLSGIIIKNPCTSEILLGNYLLFTRPIVWRKLFFIY